MKRNVWLGYLTALLILTLYGCGGLRYSQIAPEAKDFHPKNIGVLPADVGTYEEARGVIDQIIANELVNTKWFDDVVAADALNRQLQSNADFRNLVIDYKAKLKTVNFSDPEISKKIGEMAKIDAFLVVNVDYWNYAMENKEKIAKVGMGINMVDANTGKILWKASHHIIEDYWIIKPDLSKVAKKLTALMIDEMPH